MGHEPLWLPRRDRRGSHWLLFGAGDGVLRTYHPAQAGAGGPEVFVGLGEHCLQFSPVPFQGVSLGDQPFVLLGQLVDPGDQVTSGHLIELLAELALQGAFELVPLVRSDAIS
ncbi:hypothetical protein [Streptomyces hygroscopicus]|uniref:hypothetical protein n=1 Tax=Streptomyces hygroscopicus TaxID=1912 RepID=UPI0007C6471E|nr:hypothetical protein [Streptomyces hygroscopicus]